MELNQNNEILSPSPLLPHEVIWRLCHDYPKTYDSVALEELESLQKNERDRQRKASANPTKAVQYPNEDILSHDDKNQIEKPEMQRPQGNLENISWQIRFTVVDARKFSVLSQVEHFSLINFV